MPRFLVWFLVLVIVSLAAWSAAGAPLHRRVLTPSEVRSVLRDDGFQTFRVLKGSPPRQAVIALSPPPAGAQFVLLWIFPDLQSMNATNLARLQREVFPGLGRYAQTACNVWLPFNFYSPIIWRKIGIAQIHRLLKIALPAQRRVAADLRQRCVG